MYFVRSVPGPDVADVIEGRLAHLEGLNKRLYAEKAELEVELAKCRRREEETSRQV